VLILHGSDFQTGRPYRPQAAAAFVALSRELAPDLVVVSGDLTQRAKAREYRTVHALLDAVDVPLVLTPGNHDVPLHRIWERIFGPYRQWRRFLGVGLDSVTRVDGATVVALNSSAPRRAVVGGRLDTRQVAFARRAFDDVPVPDVRILVTHHHFVATPDRDGGRPLPGARELLQAFEGMGVDLVLGGHVHQTHLTTSRALVRDPQGRPGIPLLACGTTASSRGRGPETGRNGLLVIRVDERVVAVTSHFFDDESGRFLPRPEEIFPRWRVDAGVAGDVP
jgi:3',5'-cyclic AMP phosphodiesterase CpdA